MPGVYRPECLKRFKIEAYGTVVQEELRFVFAKGQTLPPGICREFVLEQDRVMGVGDGE